MRLPRWMGLVLRCATAALTLLVLSFGLAACDEGTRSEEDHRLVGVWSGVQDPEDSIPTRPEEWKAELAGPEPTHMQMAFLRDGTLVTGGLMMGHEFADEGRWEVLEDTPQLVRLRMISSSGKVDDNAVIHVEGPDLIRLEPPGTSDLKIYLRRATELGPFPMLAKYKGRP